MTAVSVALVDETGTVTNADLAALATALQTQVDRDLGPVWGVQATVAVAAHSPAGTWKLRIVPPKKLPQGAGGVHLDHNGVPYAIVGPGPDMTLAASHEFCEMLVDPLGKRMVTAPSLDPAAGGRPVSYLVEVGDPCEVFSYDIDGVSVSDFVRQDFYHPKATDQVDQLSKLSGPLTVPHGCYISWYDPADSRWHQVRPDGSIVTADRTSKLGENPRRERDEIFGDPDRHDLAKLLGAYKASAQS
jgi:hypothetical protein